MYIFTNFWPQHPIALHLLSSKVEEMYAPEINDFVYITDSAYTAEEIKNCELKLLRSIK